MLYEKQASSLCRLVVYRGHQMQRKEVDQLTVGKLVSIDSFFSTSKNRQLCTVFAGPPEVSSNLVGVLFVINVNTEKPPKNKPYADISSLSYFDNGEQEVLFMLGTVFRVIEWKYDENDHLWVIKLELCGEEDEDFKAAEISTKEEMTKNRESISFNKQLDSWEKKMMNLKQ
jgi:hypothetical protein